MTARRPRVVVLGMLTKMPVAGVVWQYLHYLLGFEQLGYEAWYVEAHGINPSMFQTDELDPGSRQAADYIATVMGKLGLGERWAYQALHDDGECFGLSTTGLLDLYRTAEVIINLHGGTMPRPEHAATDRLVYLETDPVALQVELYENRKETVEFLEPHMAFFTFGESYGQPSCQLPVDDRFPFKPARQPVVVDLWAVDDPPGDTFTTIGNFRQRWRDVRLDGETYGWSKNAEWDRVLEIPRRTGERFELSLASYQEKDLSRLVENGWAVTPAADISGDPSVYAAYIAASKGEFTVAKDQNVRLRTGWFSDRSATYLAAGRAVVTQETGFSDHLPTGLGLLSFQSADEAVEAVQSVAADPVAHGRAAAEIARDHFAADRVLRRLLDDIGL